MLLKIWKVFLSFWPYQKISVCEFLQNILSSKRSLRSKYDGQLYFSSVCVKMIEIWNWPKIPWLWLIYLSQLYFFWNEAGSRNMKKSRQSRRKSKGLRYRKLKKLLLIPLALKQSSHLAVRFMASLSSILPKKKKE